MAERWFFALWPDPATARALAARARPLIPAGARAAHPLDIHLTLRFLGVLSPDQLAAAQQAADRVRGRGLTLSLDRPGCFPRARVLWCAPSCPPADLLDLVAGLGQALADQGFPPEPRPFRPHLTLARKVSGLPAGGTGAGWGLPVTMGAAEFVLARGREGQVPRYAPWRRWPLLPPNGPGPDLTARPRSAAGDSPRCPSA